MRCQEQADSVQVWCAAAGVKLVLPAILQGVDDSAWRTKQGSIELLGTMAYLAPKQLSTSLPTVVPILGKTLSDPHPKVQASAKKALEEVRALLAIHRDFAQQRKPSRMHHASRNAYVTCTVHLVYPSHDSNKMHSRKAGWTS